MKCPNLTPLVRPPRVSKLSVELSGKKTADGSRRVLAIGGEFFYLRSIFDPVVRGQRSNFGKIDIFQHNMRISQYL